VPRTVISCVVVLVIIHEVEAADDNIALVGHGEQHPCCCHFVNGLVGVAICRCAQIEATRMRALASKEVFAWCIKKRRCILDHEMIPVAMLIIFCRIVKSTALEGPLGEVPLCAAQISRKNSTGNHGGCCANNDILAFSRACSMKVFDYWRIVGFRFGINALESWPVSMWPVWVRRIIVG